jgi:NADH-quinone oxidoreductase subunit G
MAFSDVLLPIAPFSETSGTFVNAEGRVQGFHAVVRPLGDTRPAWKVLRVLANVLGLPGFDFDSSQDVLASLGEKMSEDAKQVAPNRLGNQTILPIVVTNTAVAAPVVASLYQLDGLVRRATALQLTADARRAASSEEVAA